MAHLISGHIVGPDGVGRVPLVVGTPGVLPHVAPPHRVEAAVTHVLRLSLLSGLLIGGALSLDLSELSENARMHNVVRTCRIHTMTRGPEPTSSPSTGKAAPSVRSTSQRVRSPKTFSYTCTILSTGQSPCASMSVDRVRACLHVRVSTSRCVCVCARSVWAKYLVEDGDHGALVFLLAEPVPQCLKELFQRAEDRLHRKDVLRDGRAVIKPHRPLPVTGIDPGRRG